MSIKIVEGGFYKRSDGIKCGPANRSTDSEDYPWNVPPEGEGFHAYGDDGVSCLERPRFDLISEWSEGPVRTVTRREVFPGVYDRVWVSYPDVTWRDRPVLVALVEHDNPNPERPPFLAAMSSDELRSAAMIFSQIAEAMDDGESK